LRKIGVNIELTANYPWIYLDKVNGIPIRSRFLGNHGFTVFFKAIRPNQPDRITNISFIFKKIRDVLCQKQQ
jgi:hypothetical protein